jgi:hypothetical protein
VHNTIHPKSFDDHVAFFTMAQLQGYPLVWSEPIQRTERKHRVRRAFVAVARLATRPRRPVAPTEVELSV